MELRQTPKIMENQRGENKSINNKFNFYEFIPFISDLIGPLNMASFFFWLINKVYEKTMKVGLLIILNDSSLTQHPVGIFNKAGVHGALCRAWFDPPIQDPTILRHLKTENS